MGPDAIYLLLVIFVFFLGFLGGAILEAPRKRVPSPAPRHTSPAVVTESMRGRQTLWSVTVCRICTDELTLEVAMRDISIPRSVIVDAPAYLGWKRIGHEWVCRECAKVVQEMLS